jgi:protein-tyrosine phosphatase
MSDHTPSIDGCYWVHERLLAGEYPGGWTERKLRKRLRALLGAGVTFFLDLTEAGEKGLRPYDPTLRQEAGATGREVEYRRVPIPDFDTPSADQMRELLDALDAALAAGHTVFVHCYAGAGRTGTVVGCFLARHGLSGKAALSEIARLRRDLGPRASPSPITDEQRQMVHDWVG